MADGIGNNQTNKPFKKLEVKFVGGGRYDLANLPKTKSGTRRRSFRRRTMPRQLEDLSHVSAGNLFCEDESEQDNMATDVPSTSNQCVGRVSTNDAYFSEVCRASAVVTIGLTFMAFAVQDFDAVKGLLKEDIFVLVERSLHNFGSSLCWVYRCSCDISRSNYLLSLNTFLQGTVEELNDRSKPCNHCIVVEKFVGLVETVDGSLPESIGGDQVHNDHEYYNMDSIFELPCSQNVVCSFVGGEYSFVGSDQHGLKCLTCKYDTHSCVHVTFVQNKLDEDDESSSFLSRVFSDRPIRRIPSTPFCLSKLKIKFNATVDNLHSMQDMMSLFSTDKNGIFQVMSVSDDRLISRCTVCSSSWSRESAKENRWLVPNVKIFLFSETIACDVLYSVCSNPTCDQRRHFDGNRFGILNMGKYLFSHEVLRDYMHHFLFGSCTLQTYHQVWLRRLRDVGSTEEEMPSYNQLGYAWYSFLDLLEIDYAAGSICSECGTQPEIVVCDATTVAFRKTMVLRCDPNQTRVESANVMTGSHKERVMISSNSCRKLMMKIANSGNLTDHQFNELVQQLTTHCPPIVPFVNWIKVTYESLSDCPSSIKDVVRALAASSPVCGLIRPNENIHQLFGEIVSGVNVFNSPAKVKLLHEECPVLFAALRELSPSILPRMWRPMIDELLTKSLAPFVQSTSPIIMPTSLSDRCTDADALSFFPTLPKRRL